MDVENEPDNTQLRNESIPRWMLILSMLFLSQNETLTLLDVRFLKKNQYLQGLFKSMTSANDLYFNLDQAM